MNKFFLALIASLVLLTPAFAQSLAPLDVPPATMLSQTASFNAAILSTNMVDTTAGAVVCSLPDATQYKGRGLAVYCQVHGSGHNVTFAAQVAGQNVNGAAASSLTALSAANTGYVFLSDGSNWFAVSGLIIK